MHLHSVEKKNNQNRRLLYKNITNHFKTHRQYIESCFLKIINTDVSEILKLYNFDLNFYNNIDPLQTHHVDL